MSRVGFLKRLFTVFVLPALILAMVSFASAQEEKTDTADPSAPQHLLRKRRLRKSIRLSVRLPKSRRSRIPSR